MTSNAEVTMLVTLLKLKMLCYNVMLETMFRFSLIVVPQLFQQFCMRVATLQVTREIFEHDLYKKISTC